VAAPEQLHQDLAAVAAEAQWPAAEDLAPPDVEAVLADLRAGEEIRDLLPELRGEGLIGFQDKDPLVADRQVLQPPLEDPGDDPAVLVGQVVDLVGPLPGDLLRAIRALGA